MKLNIIQFEQTILNVSLVASLKLAKCVEFLLSKIKVQSFVRQINARRAARLLQRFHFNKAGEMKIAFCFYIY